MARLADIVFDCRQPSRLARFWAEVLHGFEVAPYDDEERARLRAMGIDDIEDDPTVLVLGPEGGPRLFFQYVPEPKTLKNRVHLDLEADDPDAEVERLVVLGATIRRQQDGEEWIGLADPEGNEFCLKL